MVPPVDCVVVVVVVVVVVCDMFMCLAEEFYNPPLCFLFFLRVSPQHFATGYSTTIVFITLSCLSAMKSTVDAAFNYLVCIWNT